MIKKADVFLIGAILIFSIALFFLVSPTDKGSEAVIRVNNEVIYRLPLNKDTEIKLTGNTVVIENGYAFVSSATCPDKICVNHQKISKSGQSIICLPNGVIVEVE